MKVSYHTPVANATLVAHHVTTTPNSAAPILSTKRAYAGIADYAQAHGLTAAALQRWQWQQATKAGRPALRFETKTGPRYRFLDGQSPSYIHETGYQRSWYGLSEDLIASIDDETPLVICNGEISTVTAQTYLVPAVCITSGEKSAIPQNLLDTLADAIPGASIIIALDCDPTGRRAAAGMTAQLNAAGFNARAVDLGLFDGGDLADFCVMHGAAAYERLMECAPLEMPETPAPVFTPRVMPAPRKPSNLSPDAEQRRRDHFESRWNGAISALERTTSMRWQAAFTHACLLFDLVYTYGYRSESEASAAITNACEVNGYRADHGAQMVRAQINGALNQPRQTLDIPDYDNPAPRAQKSAQAEILNYSPKGETAAPAALPDAIVMRGLDEIWGWRIVSEITFLLYAMARGLLPSIFFQEDRNAIPGATPVNKNLYTEMANLGILKRVSSEFFLDFTHIDSNTWVKTGKNTAGRKKIAYQLVSIDELKRLMFKPMARSLMLESMQSDEMLLTDETLIPLVRYVLEELLTWSKLEDIHVGTVRYCLKKADKHRDYDVLEAIKALQITDPALITAMELEAAAPAAAAFMQQANQEIAHVIALKNQLVARLYKAHLKTLDNPTITPLPESAPRHGQAWRNAFYNALIKPYHEGYLWPDELSAAMGIEDKNTTKNHAAAAGIIIGESRFEVRAFTIETQDYKPSWDDVRRAAKDAAKSEDKALDGRVRVYGPKHLHSVIRSYDENGRLVGKGYASDTDEPDDWRIGGTHFTVELDLRPLITVLDAAPLADETPETPCYILPAVVMSILNALERVLTQILAMPPCYILPAVVIAVLNALERALAQILSNEPGETAPHGNRITHGRLHDDDFMLRRLLASYCCIGKHGMWCNPLNLEEVFETHAEALDDLTGIINPSQLKAVS